MYECMNSKNDVFECDAEDLKSVVDTGMRSKASMVIGKVVGNRTRTGQHLQTL